MRSQRREDWRAWLRAGLIAAALTLSGAAAQAASLETLGLPAGTGAETATPTPTEAPPTPTNTRAPTFALVDNGGCAIAAPAAATPLPLLSAALVLWLARRRLRRR